MISKLIVGLGNPEEKYASTRHNFGARAVAAFRQAAGEEKLSEAGIACLLPTLNMNDSGRPVAEFLKYHPLPLTQILLVHDELELPLGEYKFQAGGGARGHKGVRSVQAALGTLEIPRLRLGIGRPAGENEVADYVLEPFSTQEAEIVQQVLDAAAAWLQNFYQIQSAAS